jgi:hypothetical protein
MFRRFTMEGKEISKGVDAGKDWLVPDANEALGEVLARCVSLREGESEEATSGALQRGGWLLARRTGMSSEKP